MTHSKKVTWTVEFSVDVSWVDDGFNLTNEKATEMINSALPYALSDEVLAKVVKSPTEEEIMHATVIASNEEKQP